MAESTDALPIITRTDAVPAEAGFGLLVDKPAGLTSFGVIRRLRRALGVKKVGHAGTLDPMATGLLIVLVGRPATRQQDRFMGLPKTYTGTIRLGETTASYDAESPVEQRRDASHVTDAEIEAVRQRFVGEILQRPPAFSAIKRGGERLYAKARRGEVVEVAPRPVTVYDLAITARQGDALDFRVDCSKGFYVRSLAHDVGEALGVGGHLAALRRTAIGPFRVEEAFPLAALADETEGAGERGHRRDV
ncbi:MAG: tRNA pseudouridine(55) synthase TruB [Rubricoccaceae bacterium]|nr:tRNA pseudouridine(55) synthase TruB [Rubricoccaceae bacterium]